MKFTVNTNDFKTAMEKVIKAVPKKSALSIIQSVHVTIDNNTCRFYATDLETTIISNIKAETDATETISFILDNISNIHKALKFFKNSEITFDIDNSLLVISCGDKKINQRINIEDIKNFPDSPIVNNDIQFNYNIKELKKRFDLIKYATAKIDSRPIFQGIHFNGSDMVAMDGFVLAVNTDEKLNISTPVTVPETALKIITDILKNDISININDKYILISDDNTTVISRLLSGAYHNYKQNLPSVNIENNAKFNVNNVRDALKYLKTFITEKEKEPIKLHNNELKLKNKSGAYEVNIDIKNTFEDVVGFNCGYMFNALSQFENDVDVILSNRSPIILRQNNNLALVMPVNIKD